MLLEVHFLSEFQDLGRNGFRYDHDAVGIRGDDVSRAHGHTVESNGIFAPENR